MKSEGVTPPPTPPLKGWGKQKKLFGASAEICIKKRKADTGGFRHTPKQTQR